MVNKTFKIEGMTCASCARAVERATRRLEGVASANVNLATEKLAITFEPSVLSVSDIKKAVKNAGYKAVEEDGGKSGDSNEKERRLLWRRFIISVIVTVPLLYISMGHMAGLPLPGFIDPMMNPRAYAITQLILTLPWWQRDTGIILWGLKPRLRSPNMDSLVAIEQGAVVYGIYA